MTTKELIGNIFLIYPSLLLKNTMSILPFSSSQDTLLGRFLILGKLYFITLTLIVVILPISNLSKVLLGFSFTDKKSYFNIIVNFEEDGTSKCIYGRINPFNMSAKFQTSAYGVISKTPVYYYDKIFSLSSDGRFIRNLTNGSNPYSLSLSQNSTTAQNYSMTGTCYTSGGCSVSVTQN